jgi:hypothetical protein
LTASEPFDRSFWQRLQIWRCERGCRAEAKFINHGLRAALHACHTTSPHIETVAMLRDLAVLLYAITTGFTASGIVSNVYWLVMGPNETSIPTAYYVALPIAGPNVFLQKIAEARRAQSCSHFAFWVVTALCGYWSLAIGLFILSIALAL